MRTTTWICLLTLCAWAPPAAAQQDEALVRLVLRVTSNVGPGRVVVDRGTRDGVASGDRVQLFPREGGPWWGTVDEVAERSAEVELADRGVTVAPGTRGEMLIPRERLETPAPQPVVLKDPSDPKAAPDEDPAAAGGEPAKWQNPDEEYDRSLPLLAQVGVVRPEERASRVMGRLYLSADQMFSTEDRADTYMRLGTDLVFENPFGRGGILNLDGELLYRATEGPDNDTNDGTDARLDRASYAWGGTRFDSTRWEVGRFLQYGMPEFGVVDGVELRRRTAWGDSWGVSLGFMPSIDENMHSTEDLQLAASYQWLVDDAGRLRLEGGFQKTLHDYEADRDLLVAKLLYLPENGWDLRGTAWVDFYDDGDVAKDTFAEFTQAWLSTRRVWDGGDSLQLSYRHLAFPELLREEFEPVGFGQLADDHYDRLAADGRLGLSRKVDLRAIAGAWVDEDDSGGDLEVGFEGDDVLVERGRADVSAFGSLGRYSWVAGARASVGQFGPFGHWRVFYEASLHHQEGFSNDLDDILQHRLGARQNLTSVNGWNLSLHAIATVWEDDAGLQLGFFMQRSF